MSRRFRLSRAKSIVQFIGLYAIFSFVLLPFIASFFGRESLPIRGTLRPVNIMTCVLNRHYVIPELKRQMLDISMEMNRKFEGTSVNYLDANFPFFDGFPLIPHLSHNDGLKIDLAFYYIERSTGRRVNSSPSFTGYGIFERPKEGEINYPKKCKEKGYWQYDAISYITPDWNKDKYKVDVERTRELVMLLAENSQTSKLFIEPHLKERWNLSTYEKIRFHGCYAVRHDDHIHTQIYRGLNY